MSLLSLANETLLEITKGFGPKDLNSLIQSSYRLAELLTPQFNEFALQPKYRVTALYWAAVTGNKDLVRLVLKKGKNIMIKEFPKFSGDPGTIVYYASSRRFNEELVQHILEKGLTAALIVQDNLDGTTPLHWAVRHGHDVMFKMLLERVYYLENKDYRGWTALHQAVNEENEMAVELLLDQGADINAKDKRGSTPIHHAAMSGSEVMARMLLEWHGLKLDCMDVERDIPFETAEKGGHRNVAKLLLEMAGSTSNGHRKATVCRVKRNYEIEHVSMMLLIVGDAAWKNVWTESELHLAIRYGYTDCAKSFVQSGADITVANRTGDTPLHLAAQYADTEMVDLLLDKGSDINGQNAEGWTPLHLAVFYNLKYKGVVDLLLKRRADTTLKTNAGDTAMDLARNDSDSNWPLNLFGSTQTSNSFGSAQTSNLFGSAQASNPSGSAQTSNLFGSAQTSNPSGSAQTSNLFGPAPKTKKKAKKKEKKPAESGDSGGHTEQSVPETPRSVTPAWQMVNHRPAKIWQLMHHRPTPAWQVSNHIPTPAWIMVDHVSTFTLRHQRNVIQRIESHSDEWHKRQSEAEERGKELVKLLLEYGAEIETETDESEDE